MTNSKQYFAKDISNTLSSDLKETLKKTTNLMMVKDNGVSIIPLSDNLEKITKNPLISITDEEIEFQNLKKLPNMYYPLAPHLLELKATYFLAKNLANEGIIPWNLPIHIYDDNKNYEISLNLGPGR